MDSQPIYKGRFTGIPHSSLTMLSTKRGTKGNKAVSFLARYLFLDRVSKEIILSRLVIRIKHHLMEDNWDLDPNKMAGLVH